MNRRPGEVAQLEVARKEVGVEVRQDDMLDPEAEPGGIREIAVDVALRVDHRGETALLVADEIGGMRKAAEVVLLEDHGPHSGAGGPQPSEELAGELFELRRGNQRSSISIVSWRLNTNRAISAGGLRAPQAAQRPEPRREAASPIPAAKKREPRLRRRAGDEAAPGLEDRSAG